MWMKTKKFGTVYKKTDCLHPLLVPGDCHVASLLATTGNFGSAVHDPPYIIFNIR